MDSRVDTVNGRQRIYKRGYVQSEPGSVILMMDVVVIIILVVLNFE